ncbi:ROK family protein [Parvularcula maris]|uniref:fructokinase n=1 Tax=Parvularcula maris TaxID=2965077 RepID=A0A9X2L7N9_9PROT|nr:ROK family protein [Parvularcula maris]
MSERELIAGIDAGGTTFKLGIAEKVGTELLDKTRVPTAQPAATIAASIEALKEMARRAGGRIVRVGIASFGPVDVDSGSESYGSLLATPKPGWSAVELLSEVAHGLGARGVLDTDVNGALEAEMAYGAAAGLSRAAYVTVGTGIGVGILTGGGFAGRPGHPELGHIRVARHAEDTDYAGRCSFHGDCLEGLASAPALEERFGPLPALGEEHEAWRIAGFYLAQLAMTLSLGYRLERIVFGGGVMLAPALLGEVRRCTEELNAGYLPEAANAEGLIARAALGDDAGLIGALHLTGRLER